MVFSVFSPCRNSPGICTPLHLKKITRNLLAYQTGVFFNAALGALVKVLSGVWKVGLVGEDVSFFNAIFYESGNVFYPTFKKHVFAVCFNGISAFIHSFGNLFRR